MQEVRLDMEVFLWIGGIRCTERNDEILPYATKIEAIKNNIEGRQYLFLTIL
jgi:hypothetical protein